MCCRSTFVVFCVLVACARQVPQETAPHDWLIIPATRIGPVGAATSEQDLIKLLGPEPVVRQDNAIGEGLCAPGTVLYSGTTDAVDVTWTDSTYSTPAVVGVAGKGSRWRTPAGLRVGIELKELVSLASGAPIQFTGFGWDYGGTASWSELTPQGEREVGIGLAPDSASLALARQDARYAEIAGEQTVSSDHPLIREMTIRVERIFIRWSEPKIQQSCTGL
jgi:hypothetical protein